MRTQRRRRETRRGDSELLLACGGRDELGHVGDLLRLELVTELRHPALTQRHPRDDELVRGLGVVEVRADGSIRARGGERVAGGAALRLEDRLALRGIALERKRRQIGRVWA